ncbi:hypothetical protein LshimejAT787_0900510 [Lyophyllum shimeji]|uniref:Uncharacterized protein n=1 Tax=Lyophyllum shimeji TaxID=47721 RepID=A0A9P3PSC0_LYOSH|nr:hypothetical protein LshimejAT787_0900510 [Lyophyllum shimeji]
MPPTSTYLRLQRLRTATSFLSLTSTRKTKHFLKASAEPILRAFRLPHAEHAEFPRGKPTILDWATALIAHYASQDDAEISDRHRRRMGTLTIKEVRWYRGATGIEHEYVVAIVADPQHDCERYVRLDRARDDPGVDVVAFPVGAPPHPRHRYARSSESFSSSQSSLSFYDEPVDVDPGNGCVDAMWVLRELPESDRLIERSTFRGSQGGYGAHAPTLLDLALVARAVHENNNYHPWPRQCVWFATMIVRVLQADFRHQITHRDSSLTFQNWMIEVLGEGVGTFKAKAIYKEQEQVIEDVLLAYRASREEVMKMIAEAATRVTRHREQHEIIDEAVAQRDEAAAIAAAAAASSVEATARAAEAAARAAEAEARAEREARLREEAEERAHDEARKHAMSEREVRDLRRRLEELELSCRSRERRRQH